MASALAGLAAEGRLLVAVSAGSDSVAALRLALDLGRDVAVAHFDHRLRATSAADADFVRELCDAQSVEFFSAAADVAAVATERRWNLEDAARRLRYEFLHRAAKKSGSVAIVVAHTRDDQAETFLLQSLRGSAFPTGMPARRGLVVRPLLSASRASLQRYLLDIGQAWREDESNRDLSRNRAWLRHELLPQMASRFPRVAQSLANSATVLGDADSAIDTLARQLLGHAPFKVAALVKAPVAVQRSAIAGLIEGAGAAPTFALIEQVRGAVIAHHEVGGAGPWRVSLDKGSFVRVAYGLVEVVRRAPRRLGAPVRIVAPDEWEAAVVGLQADDLPSSTAVTELLAEHPSGLTLRHRAPGDRVRLAAGGKLLSDLLIDLKLPAEERDALLLLATTEGEVVWLEGLELRPSAATEPGALSASERDRHYMRQALELARAAREADELPVGALVVRDGVVLAGAGNNSEAADDPSGHAELLALREAARLEGDRRLTGATLYVTLEPCPMCFGAVLQTRIDRVVYGAANPREGAVGSVMDLRVGAWKRRPAVEGGILAPESTHLLREFFAERR